MNCDVKKLVQYIDSVEIDFSTHRQRSCYEHVGAALVDAILQPGLRYWTVVRPRAVRIKNFYPEANTLSGFVGVVNCLGIYEVLRWRHCEKPRRLVELLDLFGRNLIETEDDLRNWLFEAPNCATLLEVKGIGRKTIDYLKLLVGCEVVPIDRHLRQFLRDAGVVRVDYDDIQGIFEMAADYLSINLSVLDSAIWRACSK